jgi:hypothetical protein
MRASGDGWLVGLVTSARPSPTQASADPRMHPRRKSSSAKTFLFINIICSFFISDSLMYILLFIQLHSQLIKINFIF